MARAEKGSVTMVTIKHFKDLILSVAASCAAAMACAGCETSGILQDATAVQLETTLITLMDGLLRTLIYNAMDIPGAF